jgi:hypothetical protein
LIGQPLDLLPTSPYIGLVKPIHPMNNDFNFDSFDENELYQSMMETDSEDWIPSTGIKEEFDYETLALLKNF